METHTTTFVLGALFPIREFTFTIGDWIFGVEEYSNYPPRTLIRLGPTTFSILDVTSFQVIGAAGFAVVAMMLTALAVFLITHRRGSSRSP
jgi:hypothetical protein